MSHPTLTSIAPALPMPVESIGAARAREILKRWGCRAQIGRTAWIFAFHHPLLILKG
jgi:hypothetical protein